MINQHRATPEQWAYAADRTGQNHFACILELRARVEALEAQQRLGWREPVYGSKPAVDTVQLHTCSMEAAVKESFTTQPRGLVDRVADGLGICESLHCGDPPEDWKTEARAAIREVAAWLDGQLEIGAAHLLREEAGNG